MSNKKRISKKRAQLKNKMDFSKVQVTPEFISIMKNISEAAKNIAHNFSQIVPKKLEGMMAIEIDKLGNRKTVFAGSRDYIK